MLWPYYFIYLDIDKFKLFDIIKRAKDFKVISYKDMCEISLHQKRNVMEYGWDGVKSLQLKKKEKQGNR